MHSLISISPLGNLEPLKTQIGAVLLTEETAFALASCSARLGKEQQTKTALKKFTGQSAPKVGYASDGEISAFWMGPDLWMVEAPYDTNEDLAHKLKAIAKTNASITEQTDGWCRFDIKGPSLSDVFERLCMANIRKMVKGDATRTSIEHLSCFVIMRDSDHISVLGPRSSAASLHHALVVAINSAK